LNFFYGQEILFPHDTAYRFYRLEFRIPLGGSFTGPKRFELAELTLLRSRHPTLIARDDEATRLDEIHVRITGPSLLDDYEYVNGREIMDLRLQHTSRDRPFEDVIRLRSLLDVREKTAAQIVAAQRGTRARVQFFADDQQPTSQESLSVSKQQMISGGGTPQQTHAQEVAALQANALVTALANGLDGVSPNLRAAATSAIARTLSGTQGITTERNTNLGGLVHLLEVLDAAGIPASDLVKLMTMVANSSFDDLAGVGGDMLLGAARSGLSAATGGLSDAVINLFSDDDVQPAAIDFTSVLFTPTTLVKILNGLLPSAPASALQGLSFRPAVSLSGSFGAQFIGGGSFGLSAQLDSGKSTALSSGTQAQALHGLTVSGGSHHRSRHEEEVERTQWFDWKGQEVKRAGVPTDIITIRLPLGVTLTPPAEGGETPDAFRVRIDLLPPNVKVEVRFVGQRVSLDKVQP